MKNFVLLCLLFCVLFRPTASLDPQQQPATTKTTTAVTPALSLSSPFRTFQTSFQLLSKLGNGTSGHVYCARDLATGELVAAKRVISNWSAEEADHMTLCLGHPYIIQFKEVVLDDKDRGHVYIIMELAERDLRSSLETEVWDERRIRDAVLQLLDGVGYLHRVGIIHQDLKPENLLLVNNLTQLKIADLGLGRSFDPSDTRRLVTGHHPIGTLWYMAPEILGSPDLNYSRLSGARGYYYSLTGATEYYSLSGAVEYSPEIDMWSVGCIMAELVCKEPLFPGTTAADQLLKIYDILGTPEQFAAEEAAATAEGRPQFWIRRLREMIPPESLSPLGFDLLTKLLYLDPSLRYTADHAVRHSWFSVQI